MLKAGMNDLAMRVLVFHGGRGGDGLGLLLMGVVAVGVLVWALAHSSGSHSPGSNQSAKN
jgi:hypothetical protein